ncbi:MAG: DUF1345 domain-containing protein [Chitinophagaceae bacterium]|nr:DUF1345 domain-containing protein [Chitinophagaceae bacterium]
MAKIKREENFSLYYALSPYTKMAICLVVGIAAYFIFPLKNADNLSRIMLAWDVFCICLLSLYWFIFYTTKPSQIRELAPKEDPSRVIIFFITLIATTASMLAVILLLTANKQSADLELTRLIVSIAGSIFSWSLVHTAFAVRYAHLYYDDDRENKSTHAGGLDFPKENKPDFIDFAYFSFVLGMTFQVSDVEITSRRIRRLALWHGLISFAYNVVIIALTINIIASLGGK